MIKYVLYIEFLMLLGCSTQNIYVETESLCHEIDCIKWTDKKRLIQYYEQSLNAIGLDDNNENISLTYEQIDAMLYLSYIYLTDNKYKDIVKANNLLTVAKKAIWQDCDGYHGHYDNFCYFQYYQDEIPIFVNNLEDAIIIYQMTLPCVHIDMIQENEKAIGIIDGYFGSSRDASIPTLCDAFNPYNVASVDDITSLTSYIFLKNLNKEPETEGTIRFGFSRTRYHDLVYMLTYPQKYFTTDDFKKLHIKYYTEEIDIPKQFFAYRLEEEINKHKDLKNAYKVLQESIKNHYMSFLYMQADDAANYARMTASMIILQDIFIR